MADTNATVASIQAEEIEFSHWLTSLIPCKSMLDVGAHHGSTLRPFLEAGWQVVAFEPIEANRRKLADNFGEAARLTIRPEAVSNVSGTKELQLALNLDGSLHEYYHSFEKIGDDAYHKKGAVVALPAVSLDDLVERGEIPERVGFLKIDTEGHDLAVLMGAKQLKCAVISVEFWCDGLPLGKSPSPPEEMIKLLAERGFDSYLVVSHQGGSTAFLRSTFEGTLDNSWGNILFFHHECAHIYESVLEQLDRSVNQAEVTLPTGRFHELLARIFARKPEWFFLDVGAYKGDFTADLRKSFPKARGILFEPTPATFAELETRFKGQHGVQVLNVALGDAQSTTDFYTTTKPYTNSLLLPKNAETTHKISVNVETIDRLSASWPKGTELGLLKIDTQGHDLQVLKGAVRTLATHRPVVLAEVIFTPHYEHQDSYFELMQFMKEQGYQLAGMFNAHSTENDVLSFADWLFLPDEVRARLMIKSDRFICHDPESLLQQNRVLQAACDERLELIHRLSAEAQRLSVELNKAATHPKADVAPKIKGPFKRRWLPWVR